MTFSLRTLARRGDDFIFGPVDVRVCAWLRIGLGLLLLVNLTMLSLDFELWFGDSGVMPHDAARGAIDPDTKTLFTLLPRVGSGLTFYALLMLLQAFMLTIGFLSRFNAACLFVWLVSLQHRNHLLFDGEDLFFRLFVFFLIFLPIGGCWSVDAWRRRKLGKQPQTSGSRWPLRLIQFQLALIYLSTVWLKLDGEEWLDGSALWYVVHLDDVFGGLPIPDAMTASLTLLRLAGWGVILVEIFLIGGPFFSETRRVAIVAGFALHLTLELTMNLFLFEWLMMLALTSHLRGDEVEAVIGKLWKFFVRLFRRDPKKASGQSADVPLEPG